jgi:hypothetical protein
MPQPKPLSTHQQELVNVVKVAHQNLALARKLRAREIDLRITAQKKALAEQLERDIERIRDDVDREITQHEAALDTALIGAYENGVPILRIATDGFGNRYPGAVQALIVKLREEGLVGSSEGYQRNTADPDDIDIEVSFPKPVNADELLTDRTTIADAIFSTPFDFELVAESAPGAGDGINVKAVTLTMDTRDPYFKAIEKNARPGTPFLGATSVTLYQHPTTGELITHESNEPGTTLWDHPVARWVKDHPEEARIGFDSAIRFNA